MTDQQIRDLKDIIGKQEQELAELSLALTAVCEERDEAQDEAGRLRKRVGRLDRVVEAARSLDKHPFYEAAYDERREIHQALAGLDTPEEEATE